MGVPLTVRNSIGTILIVSLIAIVVGDCLPLIAKEPTIEELKSALKSPKASSRRNAAKALGRTFSGQATQPLLLAAADSDIKVRREVIKALGLLKDINAITVLLTALKDSDFSVRKEAIVALVNLYTQKEASFFLSKQAKRIYQKINLFSNPIQRDSTIIELDVLVSPSVIDSIAERLSDSNKSVRLYAASSLGVLRGRLAIPQMIKAMKTGSPRLRLQILQSFYKIRDRSVDEEILVYLFDPNKAVRNEAILTLGLFKSEKALPKLEAIYNRNSKNKLQQKALEAISLIGDVRSLELFRGNLTNKDSEYRQYAGEGIARIALVDNSSVEDVSRAFLSEKTPKTQLAFSFALFRLGRPEYLDRIVASLNERSHVNQAEVYLVELGSQATPLIVKYLANNDSRIRQKICRVLGLIGDKASIESLNSLLHDGNADVVSEAALAIRRINAKSN